jgi:hypothetical protein
MERRKYIDRVNEYYIKSYTSKTIRVDEKGIVGYASLLKYKEVNQPFMVGDVCL